MKTPEQIAHSIINNVTEPYKFAAVVEAIADERASQQSTITALVEALAAAISWIEDLPRKNASHQLQEHHLDKMRAALSKAQREGEG